MVRESNYPEPIPTHILELSFPAMKGARGAPVIKAGTGNVVGMVIENREQELLTTKTTRRSSKKT